MTVQDVITQAREELEGVVEDLYKPNTMLKWANEGLFSLFSKTRTTRQDWYVKRIRSTDGSVAIPGETENFAANNLQIQADKVLYTMPPDLVEVRQITPLNESDRDSGFTFIFRDMAHPEFVESVYEDGSSDTNDRTFLVDPFGVNQLRLTPTPDSTIETEMWYVGFPQRHLLTDTLTFPDWAYSPVVAWIVYKAHKQTNHDDTALMFEAFDARLGQVIEAMTIRQSQDPSMVPGVWDTRDTSFEFPSFQVSSSS